MHFAQHSSEIDLDIKPHDNNRSFTFDNGINNHLVVEVHSLQRIDHNVWCFKTQSWVKLKYFLKVFVQVWGQFYDFEIIMNKVGQHLKINKYRKNTLSNHAV